MRHLLLLFNYFLVGKTFADTLLPEYDNVLVCNTIWYMVLAYMVLAYMVYGIGVVGLECCHCCYCRIASREYGIW